MDYLQEESRTVFSQEDEDMVLAIIVYNKSRLGGSLRSLLPIFDAFYGPLTNEGHHSLDTYIFPYESISVIYECVRVVNRRSKSSKQLRA